MNNTNRPLALVTGASSGIGAELAVEFARRGYDLLLTARDGSRLTEVAGRVTTAGASADTLILDLGAPDAVATLVGFVGTRPLDVLANNAGFGDSAAVVEADPVKLTTMIHLNITVLTLVTRALLPAMVTRGRGRILNLASTAAFSPVPTMAVYGATKAYVLSFSAALSEELVGTGVTVTALCPGATTTRFADRASLGKSGAFQGAMSAETVAQQGVAALLAGKRTRVNGVKNQLMAFSTRFAPRRLAASIAQRMMAQE
jgi:short-subunit dehydrogenase